jgi:hypothetical protein
MRKNTDPFPIKVQDNASNIVSVNFDLADLPMVVSALLIGANTVMMCAGGKAENRMRYYYETIKKLAPPGWEHFDREEDIANIVIAMQENPTWKIYQKKIWKSDKKGTTIIEVGKFKCDVWSATDEEHAEIVSCLRSLAPLSCEQEETESIYERNYL